METSGINVGHHERPDLPPALVGSLATQHVQGVVRHRGADDEPVFVIGDETVEFELVHEFGLREAAAQACERLAGALLAHASLIRARAGNPRRTAHVYPPAVEG